MSKSFTPFFVAIADVHARFTIPKCRKEVKLALGEKLSAIRDIAKKENVPIICAGDMFDDWRCEYNVVNELIYLLRDIIFGCCYGQHELPYHDMNEFKRSPLYTLELSLHKHESYSAHDLILYKNWNQTTFRCYRLQPILVTHMPCYHKDNVYRDEGQGEITNIDFGRHFDVVISGDNHKAFKHIFKDKYGKRTLWINCGCVLRCNAAEKDYEPCCWLVGKDSNNEWQAYQQILPYHKDAVSDEHVVKEKMQEEWESEFLKSLPNQNLIASIKFKSVLEDLLRKAKTPKEVQRWVRMAVEKVKLTDTKN